MTGPVDGAASGTPIPAGYEDLPHTLVKLRARRRAIARNLTAAAAVPSLTADVRVDLSAVLAAREEHNGRRVIGEAKASLQAFIVVAAVDALGAHPDLNATFTDAEIIRWSTVNVGIAVDTPGGLVVPVIRNAERLDVAEMAQAIADLAERGRAGSLELIDLQGGTFTLSNPGAVGPCLRAEALLNPPQTALLGLPGMRREPLVVTDDAGVERLEIRSVLDPSLTFDHRAVDGGEAVRFLVDLRDRLQSWTLARYRQPAAVDR
jgi:pyruvate/2-oxoglutarate dehydrogenase complex dihydrolipoamide acyltransferase (E2) component